MQRAFERETLVSHHIEFSMKNTLLQYFQTYGPSCPESPVLMVMIVSTFTRYSPFEAWCASEKLFTWAHVSGIFEGTIRTAERIRNGMAVILGTTKHVKKFIDYA